MTQSSTLTLEQVRNELTILDRMIAKEDIPAARAVLVELRQRIARLAPVPMSHIAKAGDFLLR